MAYIYNINDLELTIADSVSPIVILFGPCSCGKTMALVRMTRWLERKGYSVEPDYNCRPSFDDIYRSHCEHFNEIVYRDKAAPRTPPMLYKVRNRYGEPICQILDNPGDLCFDNFFPYSPFPLYMEYVMNARNKKIWIFFVEADKEDARYRSLYAEKISNMYARMTPSDKVIFVCSKADLSHHLLDTVGQPHLIPFFRTIIDQYLGIFSQYENHHPITKLWRKYNFDFVVFSTGTFFDAQDGSIYYQQGPDSYPANLWKSIMKAVRKMK